MESKNFKYWKDLSDKVGKYFKEKQLAESSMQDNKEYIYKINTLRHLSETVPSDNSFFWFSTREIFQSMLYILAGVNIYGWTLSTKDEYPYAGEHIAFITLEMAKDILTGYREKVYIEINKLNALRKMYNNNSLLSFDAYLKSCIEE